MSSCLHQRISWLFDSVCVFFSLIHLSRVTADAPRQRPNQPGATRPVCAAERGLSSAEQGAEQEGV